MMTSIARAFTVFGSMAILLTSLLLSGCSGGDDGVTGASNSSGSSGSASVTPLTVSLAWDPTPDPGVTGYVVHYGRYSPNSAGSCSYENALFVSYNQGTVVNLLPETLYYFSVSSYNGAESGCSSEVSTVTPSLPT